jgi:hypothetical protein
MKPACLVCRTGPSGLPSFEQELPALVCFMCEHILANNEAKPDVKKGPEEVVAK